MPHRCTWPSWLPFLALVLLCGGGALATSRAGALAQDAADRLGAGAPLEGAGPLLTTAWHQRFPYDKYCPMGDGGRTAVGCVITATAQIMRYHRWPLRGNGGHSYVWDGDQTCGGNVGGGLLSAAFADSYDWSNMPDDCTGGCTATQQNALAELSYEVGVAGEADYGRCGTAAHEADIARVLVENFHYEDTIVHEVRSAHTAESWFAMIRSEIDTGAPILYSNGEHAWVCDGWRLQGGANQIHINWGTDENDHSGWWNLDQMPDTPDPMDIYLYRGIRPLCSVGPEGADFPTIQAALDYLPGPCGIVLGAGVHTGAGNRDIDLAGRTVSIRSSTGRPEECVLDCGGTPSEPHRAFRVGNDCEVLLQGFTIRGGFADRGGAVLCDGPATFAVEHLILRENGAQAGGGALQVGGVELRVEECRFIDNQAPRGGAIVVELGGASLSRCEFAGNASAQGGALHASAAHVTLDHCTLHASAGVSGAVLAGTGAVVTAANTILTGTTAGGAVTCVGGGTVSFSCSDLWGNEGGDWTGCIESQAGTSGNFSADPMYCDSAGDDFHLDLNSPCAPAQNPGCWQVGANPVGCAPDSILIVCADGAGPYPTIQSAIDASTSGDVVLLTTGTYRGAGNRDLDFRGRAITLRSEASLPESCRIECEGLTYPDYVSHRGIRMDGIDDGEGRVEGITIRGGAVITGNEPTALGGGAILCTASAATFGNCTFEGNSAAGPSDNAFGGAVCVSESTVRITRCTIRANESDHGGGIGVLRASVFVQDCALTSNEGSQTGAGIACHAGAHLDARDCVLEGNHAQRGGGLAILESEALLTGLVVRGNSGRGCYAENSDITVTGSTFAANSGGGVWSRDGAAQIILSTIHSNNAGNGGAVFNEGGTLEVTGCTLYSNTASVGGGIYTTGDVTVSNTIIANCSNGAVRCSMGGLDVVLRCCDLFANGGNWTGCIAGQEGIDGNFSADPMFCDAAGSQDFHLRDGSPCLPQEGGCEQIGSWGGGCDPTSGTPSPTATVGSVCLGPIVPNPSTGSVTIHLARPADAGRPVRRPSLTLYDLAGRKVRDLSASLPADPGEAVVSWDGLDERGSRVAAGMYYLLLEDSSARRSHSLLRLR